MRNLILLLILLRVDAATVTVCSSGCTTTSLQTALDSLAGCGDDIQIKSTQIKNGPFTLKDRGCSGGTSRITVTSDRAAWLPFANTRTTPSHTANSGILNSTDGQPVLTTVLTAGAPAKHWTFVGIGFTSSFVGVTLNLVLGKNYVAANNSEIPDDIIFDRCLFFSLLPNGTANVRNAVVGDIRNLVIKNCSVIDMANPGQESHGFTLLTTPGPSTFTNNLIIASSIPIFSGGSITDYGVTVANVTAQYNYTWKPWKWLSDPLSPYYADYLANGSYATCLKNNGEFKWGDGILWQYNVGENMWRPGCQNQHNGFTNTMRTGGWEGSPITVAMGNLTMSDTTHMAWDGAGFSIPLTQDGVPIPNYGLCINLSGGWECRVMSSFNNGARTIVSATAFSSAPVGNLQWWVIHDAGQYLNNVQIKNNVFKNTAKGMNSLMLDPSNGVGGAGKLTGGSISNNLFWTNNGYFTGGYGVGVDGWSFYAGEEGFSFDPPAFTLDHNTFYNTTGMSSYLGFVASDPANGVINRQPKLQSLRITNNIAGPSAVYDFVGDGTTGNLNNTMSTYAANSFIQNNGMPGIGPFLTPPGTGPCTGSNTCSGNIAADWSKTFRDPIRGDFTVNASSPYYNAGLDGLPLGADPTTLPIIKYPYVTLKTNAAELNVDLSPPIADALNTQPCVLEVSTSSNLITDLNTYPVVPALDPTFFKQADSSATSNPLLANAASMIGSHLIFPIGKNASSVLGDDGLTHDLRLTAGTVYRYRLMCYGDTIMGSFTSASPSPRLRISGKVRLSGLVRLN